MSTRPRVPDHPVEGPAPGSYGRRCASRKRSWWRPPARRARCSTSRFAIAARSREHILPDGDPRGEPIVSNGLALCSLHHTAFDRNIFGIRPDLVIEVRKDILEETDGPMLRHGLQEIQGSRILAPRSESMRPKPEFLEVRYELFRKAS